mgnify:CR=1 FL=1
MARPKGQLYRIDTTWAASQPVSEKTGETGYFTEIHCSIAGVVTVKGSGIWNELNSGVSGAGHVDPNTNLVHAGNTASQGAFENLPATAVAFTMIAGQTIYGSFSELMSDATFTGFAYGVNYRTNY